MAFVSGCAVGPDYQKPATPVPTAFKEAAGWTKAVPADQAPRGSWWQILADPELDALEAQVDSSNQSLKEAEANYEEARQLARADHATFFPAITGSGSATREKQAASASN